MTGFKNMLPVLKVADMQRAVDFSTRTLGCTVCWRAAVLFGFAQGEELSERCPLSYTSSKARRR
jgi:hypothetical protein